MSFRSFLEGWFVLALTMSLVCSLTIPVGHAGAPVAQTADDIVPLSVGDAAPSFAVMDADGEAFEFSPSSLERPVLLLSFRGGWCPYCNVYLSEMRHVIPDIRAQGVDVLFLSGDRPEILTAGLAGETQSDIAGLDYTILSDANAQAAIALGTAFTVPESMREKMQARNYDIEDSSIERHRVLPVPSVFAIDRDGVIRFVYTNADYKTRLPADELVAVASEIAAAD